MRQREFNITGPCNPAMHYMADTGAKIDKIINGYIDRGEYFTINRARQYGKTTTLDLLCAKLNHRYIVIDLSFEGRDGYFASERAFAEGFCRLMARSISGVNPEAGGALMAPIDDILPFDVLDTRISELCAHMQKRVVLMIDEADKASNYTIFMSFLGLLRDKYIQRTRRGVNTFFSVILAGVHDIKNLKQKLRPEDKHSYNSPWNIAARFDVDMSLGAPEIATMLAEYESDHMTGMDIGRVSERLYYCTRGYPFLVSLICKTMHDNALAWTSEGVDEAAKDILKTNNTLFEDVIKNISNNSSLSALVESILLRGEQVPFEISNPDIDMGLMYGILTENEGIARVANAIFETRIYNYYISINSTRERIGDIISNNRAVLTANGKLDMAMTLNRFAAFMRSEYRDEDGAFIERHARLLFLCFLKPIINGIGHYVVEPETRGSRRMDVVVFFGGETHIVELKIWRGEQAAEKAYDQLAGYIKSQAQTRGYLLSFCDKIKSPREGKAFAHNGCEITEVIVAYRDKP